ncbi:MAG: hypothetical protein WCD37_03640 [Chloroflexia bacterium]
MPTGRDLAYEQAESARLTLTDTCMVRVWSYAADTGGGRKIITSPAPIDYSGVPCRLEADTTGIQRVDPAGELVVNDYILLMAVANGVPENALRGDNTKLVEIYTTIVRTADFGRWFEVVSYGQVSDMTLRRLYIREVF